jgi:ABC-type dipeptide/oligopeptide/nickel transport system permease subunit
MQTYQPSLPTRNLTKYAGIAGVILFIILTFFALFPGSFAPYDPKELVGYPLQRPDLQFLLGTNDIGQDLLSELIWSTRISLVTGLSVALTAILIGTVAGLYSAMYKGIWGAVLMRLADLTLVIPLLPLIILLSAYLGPSLQNIILILTLVFWAGPARLVRARALNILKEPYIEAAVAIGCTRRRIIFVHVWPGVQAIVLIQFIIIASASILAEASLSFLGLGDPSTKSWGGMLYFARASGAFLGDSWIWWVLPTGLMITLTVLSLVLISFALEGKIEPGRRS